MNTTLVDKPKRSKASKKDDFFVEINLEILDNFKLNTSTILLWIKRYITKDVLLVDGQLVCHDLMNSIDIEIMLEEVYEKGFVSNYLWEKTDGKI